MFLKSLETIKAICASTPNCNNCNMYIPSCKSCFFVQFANLLKCEPERWDLEALDELGQEYMNEDNSSDTIDPLEMS